METAAALNHSIKVSYVDSVLFPYNYSFDDDRTAAATTTTTTTTTAAKKILNEISACRFVNESTVALVGDSGELFFASVTLAMKDGGADGDSGDAGLSLQVQMLSQVDLDLPGYTDPAVDAEGVEILAAYPDALLISSETPLALTWFDRATGRARNGTTTNTTTAYDFPDYRVPEYVQSRTQSNKGFEALTRFTSQRLVESIGRDDDVNEGSRIILKEFLLTTTEGELTDDPVGYHHFMIWDAHKGGGPVLELGHWASRWKEKGDHNEYLAISDMEFWTEPELLLLLERGYDGVTNMIRLWSVDLTFPVTRYRQLLLEWTEQSMRLADDDNDDATIVPLPVDNYEAICLFPTSATDKGATSSSTRRHLLLVNDDNHNPKQIGTQFVVLQLDMSVASPSTTTGPQTTTPTIDNDSGASGGGSRCNDDCQQIRVAVIVASILLFVAVAMKAVRWWKKHRKSRVPLNPDDVNDLEMI
jgi:hypothetical protein